MSRSYRHIGSYEKEIMEMRERGIKGKEICERLGFSLKQYHNFITRHNEKQRKIAAGIVIQNKGRPRANRHICEEDKGIQLRYIIARKEAKIKTLEMENELLRDFLSLIERK